MNQEYQMQVYYLVVLKQQIEEPNKHKQENQKKEAEESVESERGLLFFIMGNQQICLKLVSHLALTNKKQARVYYLEL